MISHGAAPTCHFSRESQIKIPKIIIFVTLEAHNFLCRPLIEVILF